MYRDRCFPEPVAPFKPVAVHVVVRADWVSHICIMPATGDNRVEVLQRTSHRCDGGTYCHALSEFASVGRCILQSSDTHRARCTHAFFPCASACAQRPRLSKYFYTRILTLPAEDAKLFDSLRQRLKHASKTGTEETLSYMRNVGDNRLLATS